MGACASLRHVSVMLNAAQNDAMARAASPGHFNDPDALQVGVESV